MTSPRLPGLTDVVEIGRGGYGVVYRARQPEFGRDVAVKVLQARLDERAASAFAQECRALGAVADHPHIVAVHEAGTTDDGEPYLVLPLCAAGSLADRLTERGPLGWQEVLDIGVRLAGALQAAHTAGVLHRDIKPANVLVDAYGNPRLADFGHARHTGAEPTHSGVAITTPAYAAPEVLQGHAVAQRSDVYSLAATLVTLIAGHGPFSRYTGENVVAVMYRVLHEQPVDLRARGVPGAVCDVLEQALAKNPADRPATGAALGRSLQGVQRAVGVDVTDMTLPDAGGDTTVVPPSTRDTPTVGRARGRRARWPIVVAAVVAVAIVSGGAVVALRDSGVPGVPAAGSGDDGSAQQQDVGTERRPGPRGRAESGEPPPDAPCSDMATARSCFVAADSAFWVKDLPPGDGYHAAVYWTAEPGSLRGQCHNGRGSKGPWVTCTFDEALADGVHDVTFHTAIADQATVIDRGPDVSVP